MTIVLIATALYLAAAGWLVASVQRARRHPARLAAAGQPGPVPARRNPLPGLACVRLHRPAFLRRAVAGRAGHGDPDHHRRCLRADARAWRGGIPAGRPGPAGLRAVRSCRHTRAAGLAPAAACLAGPAGLRHPGHRRGARDLPVGAGTRAAPPRVPSLAARAAAADRAGNPAVPHDRGRASSCSARPC